jgi:peptide/nickel transport system substrate-binding protein
VTRGWLVVGLLLLTIGRTAPAAAAPEGELTWAEHVSLAPTWFDPAETPGVIVPFMVLYALHDALAKPMPGAPMAPSLAESWSVSPDGLVYDFVLRAGVRFHNGDPVAAEDVKFSLERYRGGAAAPSRREWPRWKSWTTATCASASNSPGATVRRRERFLITGTLQVAA